MSNKTRWTASEVEFLRNNLKTMEIQDIANKLGRTKQSVSGKLKGLYEKGLQRKSPKSANRYFVDDAVLSECSDILYYLMGLIAADGNIYGNRVLIKLKATDRKLLEDIKKYIGYTGPIYDRINNGYTTILTSTLNFFSSNFVKRLASHGILPNKSKTIALRDKISPNYVGSFIRGVFDGDGSVCKSKDNAFVIYICSSSKIFLEDLQKMMGFGRISTNKNNIHLLYVRSYERHDFFELIYDNSKICLNRKYVRMKESYEYVRKDNWSNRERNELGHFKGSRV